MAEALPIQIHWEAVLSDLLDRTARFPKAARFTFASRIDGLALDILELLVVARFSAGSPKAEALRDADLRLARLRAVVRVSHQKQLLDHRGYEHVARGLDEAGRMLGGWRRQADGPR